MAGSGARTAKTTSQLSARSRSNLSLLRHLRPSCLRGRALRLQAGRRKLRHRRARQAQEDLPPAPAIRGIGPELAMGSRGRRIHAPRAGGRLGSDSTPPSSSSTPPPGSGSFSTPPRRSFLISFPICSRQSPPAQTICIAEGEKKVDLIRSFGFPATCCAGGAKKWSHEHSAFLQSADVVLLPDNDPVGREHVMAIAESWLQRQADTYPRTT